MSNPENEPKVRDAIKGAPSGYFVVVPQAQEEGEARLSQFIASATKSWRILLAATCVGAAVGVVSSLLIRNTFRAQAIVAPARDQPGAGGGIRGQLGGLAALAGVDIGADGGRREESFATMTSAGLTRDFITSQNLLPVLFADRWDPEKNSWREGKKVPTIADGVRLFNDEVRSVTDDRKTNLVTVAVEWYSPELAARWANQLIDMTNERLRTIAMSNAERSIQYLNDELAKTNVVELRQAIFGLIESQINNAMLANVQHEYAFHFIDRAVTPDRKVAPKRSLISVVGAFAGFSLGLLIVFFRGASASAPRRP